MANNNNTPKPDLIAPNADNPRSDVLKPYYPSLENPSIPANPPSGENQISDAEIAQISNCLDNSIATLEKYTNSVNDADVYKKRGITIRNEQIVRDAIQFAKEYPQLTSPAINIPEWEQDLRDIDIVQPLVAKSQLLNDLAVKYQRINGVEALRYFGFYYKCMRTLSEEGVGEATVIYGVLSQFYSYLFGPREKKECPVALLESAMQEAQRVLSANKGTINNVVSDESKLKRLLSDDLATDKDAAAKK